MGKQFLRLKTKFMSTICSKFKIETKRQEEQPQQQQQQQQQTRHHPPTQEPPFKKRTDKILKSFKCPLPRSDGFSSQSIRSFCSHLCYKSCLLLYEIFKLKIGLFSPAFLIPILIGEAYSTTLAPIMPTWENDLVVCVPKGNTSSCIEYVNSSMNGLIELNESVYPALKSFRGSYDYEMIARINPYWLIFEPPSDTLYYVMGTLYLIIFVFGVTGNGLVIYMFARCKALRTASNLLVFNLAVSDLLMIIKCPVAIYNNFMRGPALGDWGCRLYAFMGGFSGCASIGLLTVISVDRYSVVVNPLSPLHFSNKSKYYYCLLTLAWFEAFFFSVIPLLEVGLSVYVPEGYLTTCSFDYLDKTMNARIFMFLFFVFAWCLPLLSICYCYYHILKTVLTSKNIQSNHNKHKIEVRLAFIALLVIGLWFLAWTPYAIVAMSGVLGMEKYLTPTRSMIPALFCKTAACLNPFLYTISHKRFRNELQRMFCKRQPIYKYSMSRNSYLTQSSSRYRSTSIKQNQNQISAYNFPPDVKKIKSKLSRDNTAIGGLVRSSLYGVVDSSDRAFYQKTGLHKKTSFSGKQISPRDSSDDASIFVLQLNDVEILKVQRLETDC